jgi:hypothetical protein
MILRIRKNGQIFTLNSNPSGLWPDTYYPIPKRLNPQDFAVEHMEINFENLGEQLATGSTDKNCAISESGTMRDSQEDNLCCFSFLSRGNKDIAEILLRLRKILAVLYQQAQ